MKDKYYLQPRHAFIQSDAMQVPSTAPTHLFTFYNIHYHVSIIPKIHIYTLKTFFFHNNLTVSNKVVAFFRSNRLFVYTILYYESFIYEIKMQVEGRKVQCNILHFSSAMASLRLC